MAPQDGEYRSVGHGRPDRRARVGRNARASGRWVLSSVALAAAAMVSAPVTAADAISDLRAATEARRGSCPALQQDSVLDSVAEQANLETQHYAQKIARFQPMEDPMPALQRLGYPASKAKLLSGYSGPEHSDATERAIYGAALFGWETIPDCTYTRYGAHVMTNAVNGNATAVILLAGG